MNVLELFAGSRSIGNICDELGHNVFSSDINAFDKIDYVTDINTFDVLKVPFIPRLYMGITTLYLFFCCKYR